MIKNLPHNSDLRNEPQVKKVRAIHGTQGFGAYIIILELLAQERCHKIKKDYDILALEAGVEKDMVQSIVEDFGLFKVSEEHFVCPWLVRKNNKEKREASKKQYGEYGNVLLTPVEYEKLKNEFPLDYKMRIEQLGHYMKSHGKKYKDHLATIRNWARKEQERKAKKETESNPFLELLGDMQ